MEMKINDNRSETRFLDAGYGDWFTLERELYMKIRDVEAIRDNLKYNAVHVETGKLFHICDSEEITPVNSVCIDIE